MTISSPASPSAKSAAAGYGGGLTSYALLSSAVAASGGILFGFDIGISGGVTATGSFLQEFFPDVFEKMKSDTEVSNYCKFNSQVLTAFTSSLYLAGLIASLFASPVTEKHGRRTSMLAGAALFLAGSALGGAAVNVYMLILARILLGFGLGFTNQKISAGWGWRLSLSAAALPATFLLLGAIFLPETPSSIIHRGGDVQSARRLLKKIRGTSEIDEELDDIIAAKAAASRAVSSANPFLLLLRRNYRPHLVMAIALPLFLNLTGINAVNFYAPVMFRSIGQKESASLISVLITRIISLVCTMTATLVAVDRFGRRAMFMAGGAVMAVSLAALGAVLKEELHEQGAVSSRTAYALVVLICLFLAAFGCSWGPMVCLVTSEIFPMEIRSAGMSIQLLAGLLFSFVLAQSFLAMLCWLKAGIFFLFGGAVVAMTAFVYWFVPETKGVAMEKIGCIWSEHWYWKRFVMAHWNEAFFLIRQETT